MYLTELLEPRIADLVKTKLTIVADKLKSKVDQNPDLVMDRKGLLNFFKKNGLEELSDIDDETLNSMIKKPPLKDVIKNIEGRSNDNKIVFNTQDNILPDTETKIDNTDTVKKMADKAAKKRQ